MAAPSQISLLYRVWLNVGMYGGLLLLTTLTLFCTPLAYLYLRIVQRIPSPVAFRKIIWWYGHLWTRLLCLFVPVRTVGCYTPLPRPCILIINHQSFFDSYCVGFINMQNQVFVVRNWPFRIPLYGAAMQKAEYLNSARLSTDELRRSIASNLKKGTSIIFFPEGTRSPDGKLGRFYSGAFTLAMETNTPIVPLCIDGMGKLLPKNAWLLQPCTVTVTLLPPLYPQNFIRYGAGAHLVMRKQAKACMQQALAEKG